MLYSDLRLREKKWEYDAITNYNIFWTNQKNWPNIQMTDQISTLDDTDDNGGFEDDNGDDDEDNFWWRWWW